MKLRTTEDWDHPIETLIEAYDQGELAALIQSVDDAQLNEWEALLWEEYDRLEAVLEHPDPVWLDADKLEAIEDRHDAVDGALFDVREELERRAGADVEEDVSGTNP